MHNFIKLIKPKLKDNSVLTEIELSKYLVFYRKDLRKYNLTNISKYLVNVKIKRIIYNEYYIKKFIKAIDSEILDFYIKDDSLVIYFKDKSSKSLYKQIFDISNISKNITYIDAYVCKYLFVENNDYESININNKENLQEIFHLVDLDNEIYQINHLFDEINLVKTYIIS